MSHDVARLCFNSTWGPSENSVKLNKGLSFNLLNSSSLTPTLHHTRLLLLFHPPCIERDVFWPPPDSSGVVKQDSQHFEEPPEVLVVPVWRLVSCG